MIQKISQSLSLFRDDYYPHLGGGNKARKMMALHEFLQKGNYDALITTGGIQSNHCRATAIYCSRYNLECTLVIHGNRQSFLTEGGNARLMREQNVNIVFSKIDDISGNMDLSMANYKKANLKPLYLNGGGHTYTGAKAYIEVFRKHLIHQDLPNYIFVPSGTGSTQAGIVAGVKSIKAKTKVIGISVGRNKKRAEKITRQFYRELCQKENIFYRPEDIVIEDRYLCGGYEKFNRSIANLSKLSVSKYGLFLDTTYSGKAFHGMLEIQKELPKENVSWFWYTGGIYNYFAR